MYSASASVSDEPSSPVSSMNVTPSSSPAFGPIDSSPPSSPGLAPYSLDSPPGRPFSHPFAASTKAIKPHPNYEKKNDSPPCTPPGIFTLRSIGRGAPASRSLQEDDYTIHGSPHASPPSHRTSRYIDREERIWDDALRQPFDTGIGQIDLSNQQLKSIPSSIGDLSGFFNTTESSEQSLFVTRVLARVNTDLDLGRTRSFERTQSIKESSKDRHVLKVYLMGNMIASLPPELFTVKNITVLSLRGNRLTFIPPDIRHLTNLNELNISNNRLTFLPWQMRDMHIEKLLVNPNPFFPEPVSPHPSHSLSSRRSTSRPLSFRKDVLASTKPILSPVTFMLACVPPLTELCLRRLLAPSPSSPSQNVLSEYYGLPISDQWTASFPPNVRRTLTDAVPGILRPHKRMSMATNHACNDQPSTTGTGTCPNPAHKGRIFVRHASERFSWTRHLAGVDVGGAVPLRWRGCMRTCLDFLDTEVGAAQDPDRALSQPVGERDVCADVDIDMAVQVVDLGEGGLDMDDFDE